MRPYARESKTCIQSLRCLTGLLEARGASPLQPSPNPGPGPDRQTWNLGTFLRHGNLSGADNYMPELCGSGLAGLANRFFFLFLGRRNTLHVGARMSEFSFLALAKVILPPSLPCNLFRLGHCRSGGSAGAGSAGSAGLGCGRDPRRSSPVSLCELGVIKTKLKGKKIASQTRLFD